jgi:2-polyprenyl-6-methoxyphenol hydroxylase-like FAD-dependent oxidoreductase
VSAKTVLIAGAGIAGPTFAYWLKRAGFEPTLVERAPALRTAGYVIDFWGLGYDIAGRMGLDTDIDRVGYHMRELRVVDGDGHRLAGFGTKVFDELTQGRFVTLGRSELSRLIFDRIKDSTETVFGDRIIELVEDQDGVRVRFAKASPRRFDLVVGADGLHSGVRELAFGPESRFEKNLGYCVAAFEAKGYRPRDQDIYMLYGIPGRMLGRFTMHDDRVLFLFIFAADDGPLPESLIEQKALLRDRYADAKWETRLVLEELDRTEDLYLDRVSQIRMPNWTRGRTALIGDAAFCVSLAAGQGSALAMISAYVLAGELAKAGGQYPEAFAAYESRLRDYIAEKQRGAARFASAFAPRTHFGMWFRNLVIKSFSIPGLAYYAAGRDIMDKLELPDYDWNKRA